MQYKDLKTGDIFKTQWNTYLKIEHFLDYGVWNIELKKLGQDLIDDCEVEVLKPHILSLDEKKVFALDAEKSAADDSVCDCHSYKDATEVFGHESQFRQAMEECAEAIQAVNKYLRNPSKETAMHVVEEFTDADILKKQVSEMLWQEQNITEQDWNDMYCKKYRKMCDQIRAKRAEPKIKHTDDKAR